MYTNMGNWLDLGNIAHGEPGETLRPSSRRPTRPAPTPTLGGGAHDPDRQGLRRAALRPVEPAGASRHADQAGAAGRRRLRPPARARPEQGLEDLREGHVSLDCARTT